MQMYHSDVDDTVRKSVGAARKRPISLSLIVPVPRCADFGRSQESQDHGLHVDFECFKLALWRTHVFLNMFR